MSDLKDGMERVPLGNDMFYTKVVDQQENWIAIVVWHDGCQVHEDCRGMVPFTECPGNRTKWEAISKEPLTLHPSVLRDCGMHGWIKGGKWVPA
jgi:hypothetical protein